MGCKWFKYRMRSHVDHLDAQVIMDDVANLGKGREREKAMRK